MVIDYKTKIPDVPENVLRILFGEFKPQNPTFNVWSAAVCEARRMGNSLDYMYEFIDDCIPVMKSTIKKHGILGDVYEEFAFDEENKYSPVDFFDGTRAVGEEFVKRIDTMELQEEEN